MTKRQERPKKERRQNIKRIARLYVKVDSERERKDPCPSSSGADWFLLILSASLSTLSAAGRKRERDVRGIYDTSLNTMFCPKGCCVCNTSTDNKCKPYKAPDGI